jgi:hypothetical protein
MKLPCSAVYVVAAVLLAEVALAQTTGTATSASQHLYSEAQRAYLRGDNEEAKELFAKVLANNPNHVGARNYLRTIVMEQERFGKTNPLENRLKQLTIPTLSLKDTSLSTAVAFLRQQAEKVSEGAIKPNIILSLPPNYADTTTVSVDLSDIPFLDALDYICRLSKTKYTLEKHGIVIEPATSAIPESEPTTSTDPFAPPKIPGL